MHRLAHDSPAAGDVGDVCVYVCMYACMCVCVCVCGWVGVLWVFGWVGGSVCVCGCDNIYARRLLCGGGGEVAGWLG
jgi:hypothetical protein